MVTRTQEKILAIIPKCCASLSIPCSIFLIYEVWCDHATRGSTPIQRALVGMSVIDILSSSGWFLSSWAVPRDEWAFATGNMATCNYQGFLLQLAIGAPLFNASLGLYYALLIRKKWTDKMLARIEYWVQGFVWIFSIGTSIALLPLKQYNQIGQVCWIIGSPVDCGDSTHISNPDVPCERGDHAWLYGVFLFYGPLWVCVACCLVCMYYVYLEVSATFRRVRRYSFDTRSSREIGRTEMDSVAIQAILYSLSFFITWMPSTLWSVAHWFRFAAFWLDFLSAFCEPLQGLWNFLIFIRARRRTKVKIRNAAATLLPFLFSKESVNVSQLSQENSGNGRRSTDLQNEEYKFRTSNLGVSSSMYRMATLKANQMNNSMFGSETARGLSGESFKLSVRFDDDEGSAGLTPEPESSLEKSTAPSLLSKGLSDVDEEPMSPLADQSPTAEFTTKDSSSSSCDSKDKPILSTIIPASYKEANQEPNVAAAEDDLSSQMSIASDDSEEESSVPAQYTKEPSDGDDRTCDHIPIQQEGSKEDRPNDLDGNSVSSLDELELRVRMYFT